MVSSGILRWSLIIVVVALIVVLVTAATVVMAGTVLQPRVVPIIKMQPETAAPGDIVTITGHGWPTLTNLVVVIALSPTKDLATDGLVPVTAVLVGPDGRFATSFVYPADLPWSTVKEAWVVARVPQGGIQASAHLLVMHPKPTPTCTPATALTPMPRPDQLQGCIVDLAPVQHLLTLRPFGSTLNRGVAIDAARIRFSDGRPASLLDLEVGVSIIAIGWYDSGGTLLATQITILGAISEEPEAAPAVAGPLPEAPVCVPTSAPVRIPPTATPCPPICIAAVPECPSPTAAPVCTEPMPTHTPEPAPTCTLIVYGPPSIPTDAWLAEYYANQTLDGPPNVVITNMVIDYSWDHNPPAEGMPTCGYSVRWTGNWFFAKDCAYRFLMLLNGGARLWVDDHLVIDAWECPPPAEQMGRIRLAGGLHTLRVEYYDPDPGVDARIQLRWEYDDVPH